MRGGTPNIMSRPSDLSDTQNAKAAVSGLKVGAEKQTQKNVSSQKQMWIVTPFSCCDPAAGLEAGQAKCGGGSVGTNSHPDRRSALVSVSLSPPAMSLLLLTCLV